MKRFVCFLLILFLPLAALAEGAPARVTEELTSNTGHTSITIDADVIVPEAQTIPRYQVKLREFTGSEILAMANALFGADPYEGDDKFQVSYDGNGVHVESMMLAAVEQVETGVPTIASGRNSKSALNADNWSMNGRVSSVLADYTHAGIEGEGIFMLPAWVEGIPEGQLTGCEISREDARAQADAAVSAFAPQMTCVAEGTTWAETYAFHQGSTIPRHHQGWVFFYTRALPLPITYEWQSPSNDYGEEVCREMITVAVDDDGIQSVRYEMPFEITQVLDENCALLPFDKIMDVARTIFPLSTGWLESSYADVREYVDRITLGYMVMLSRDNSSYCEIVPVWDFFGTRECRKDRGGEIIAGNDVPFQSLLTINAIDGTVIDRNYGY